MNEPIWMVEARKHLGQREVPGPGVNAWIRSMWLGLKGGGWFWKHFGEDDSKLPWCGAFCAHCVKVAGLPHPDKYASALAWASYGTALPGPRLGAVAVFKRAGGGHVGFVAGVRKNGNLVILGGNQDDGVTLADFSSASLVALRWPALSVAQTDAPLMLGSGRMSASQA